LKPTEKAKRSFTASVKPPKGTEEKATVEGSKGKAHLNGSER
jgi:hypothetical protein